MLPNIFFVAQSELGGTEIVPTLLVLGGLIATLTFLALVVASLQQKSYQIAGLNCCLIMGIGFLMQPWSIFFEQHLDSSSSFFLKARLIIWGLALFVCVAVFGYCLFANKKELERRRKRRRVSRTPRN